MANGLVCRYWVRALGPAVFDARRLWPRTADRMEVRRHALKLRYWPERNPSDSAGVILDLNWSWVQGMKGEKNVGELRIHDVIGGCDNIRLIFFVPSSERPGDPLPIIWILAAMQKKRDDFTTANIKTFHARRRLVVERFYEG